MLHFLYETIPGRAILKLLVHPNLSQLCGRFLDSSFSRFLIPLFVNKNNIDLTVCEKDKINMFDSFNDCFCRKLKGDARIIDKSHKALISPCDGLLSVYKINEDLVIPVKQSQYSIEDLLQDKCLADKFRDGYCFVFRLCVNHYHRYCFPDNGSIILTKKIPGILHTVRPVALRKLPVFIENSREYALLSSHNFGELIQMEVGAMLVGKINNHRIDGTFIKGQEKGHFLYGGSTIIILTQKDSVKPVIDVEINTANAVETPVLFGEKIADRL